MTNIPYADESWNPTSGCSKVSPGCARCWAETVSHRFSMTHLPWTPEHAAENVVTHPARLSEPLHWRKPRTVAVCFMGDLFHEQVPDEFIERVFGVMALARDHTFLVLTKRPERMNALLADKSFIGGAYLVAERMGGAGVDRVLEYGSRLVVGTWPLPNVWLGVTAENQRMADERIPVLLRTPAAHRWASLEPLLGPINMYDGLSGVQAHAEPDWEGDIVDFDGPKLDWVLAGGESGPAYRPMSLDWAAIIQAQCQDASVPFYMKQIAASRPGQPSGVPMLDTAKELPWE